MKQTILHSWPETGPLITSSKPLPTGEGVIDRGAFDAIEIEEVFEALNHAETIVGQSVLYRSLAQPLDSIESLHAKQKAKKTNQRYLKFSKAIFFIYVC